MTNTIQEIFDAMESDDANRAKQSNRLERLYRDSNARERMVLDAALICICGYSLDTMIKEGK